MITTAIDYANDVIHIGHAYEKILADSVARYYRKIYGKENVYFLTGTDEHGTTNYLAAKEENMSVEEYTRKISSLDRKEIDALNISYDRFIRTTDPDHVKTASNLFEKALERGDIYKAEYEGFYCEGCEEYKTLSDLDEDKKCPQHPNKQIRLLKEENYFLRWSAYENALRELIEKKDDFILPENKKNEMLAFLEQGLNDIPVSRPKYKVPWGISVPSDEEQIIYVWYDALVNYYTAAKQKDMWNEKTKIIHFVGKDILRFHALLWPVMLLSLELPLPDTIYAHGFINLKGKKISKSLGNVIRPSDLVKKYGVDAVRYYFLKHGPITEDVDISIKHLEEVYNADLANGLGNTVARIAKMAERSGLSFEPQEKEFVWQAPWSAPISKFRVDLALQNIWRMLTDLDKHINENEPWAIEDQEELKNVLSKEVYQIRKISLILEPFIPSTSRRIQEQFFKDRIRSEEPLFPKL